MSANPYRTTPVFDQDSLPTALRREHRTKAGVWGIVRVLDGQLQLQRAGGSAETLDKATPGLIRPEEPHFVTPLGTMLMQVEFYDSPPGEDA
jgi:tellurite resistance-related uncharacterized protein